MHIETDETRLGGGWGVGLPIIAPDGGDGGPLGVFGCELPVWDAAIDDDGGRAENADEEGEDE